MRTRAAGHEQPKLPCPWVGWERSTEPGTGNLETWNLSQLCHFLTLQPWQVVAVASVSSVVKENRNSCPVHFIGLQKEPNGMLVVRMTWKRWAKERHCTVLLTRHYDDLMLGPLCAACACTCPWCPGQVLVENSPQRNSEQPLGRMLRLESNQCEPGGRFRKCKRQIFRPLQFQKACFHSLHRFEDRFQQKEERNCWLLEPQPVGARQTSRIFLSVTLGGAYSPERSTGLGSWPLGHLLSVWSRMSDFFDFCFLICSKITYLIWLSWGCNEIIFLSTIKTLSQCW